MAIIPGVISNLRVSGLKTVSDIANRIDQFHDQLVANINPALSNLATTSNTVTGALTATVQAVLKTANFLNLNVAFPYTYTTVNLNSPWTTATGQVAAYVKDLAAVVHVVGNIFNNSGSNQSGAFFTLPIGFRVKNTQQFVAAGYDGSNQKTFNFEITSNGNITPLQAIPTNNQINIMCSFIAEQ